MGFYLSTCDIELFAMKDCESDFKGKAGKLTLSLFERMGSWKFTGVGILKGKTQKIF